MSGLFSGTPLERPVTCEHCSKPLLGDPTTVCTCPRDAAGNLRLPKDIHPRVRREKRRGKWSTIIAGLDDTTTSNTTDLKALLKTLRTGQAGGLGTGGGITTTTTGNTELLLQGDHRDAVVKRLCELGYKAKPAGG